MNWTFRAAAPIDDTLRRVVVGFRLVAVAWMGALVGATLATDPGVDQVVVGGTYALALAWTGITVAHALHPRWFRHPAWVGLDGLVAVWVSVSPFVAGSRDLFFGALPPLLAAPRCLRRRPLARPRGRRRPGRGADGRVPREKRDGRPPRPPGDIGVFLVAALAFGWGFAALRRYDLARTEAVEALEVERAARVRVHDRAEIAAHLHDSVLQTLALIQRDPDDPRRTASLARRPGAGVAAVPRPDRFPSLPQPAGGASPHRRRSGGPLHGAHRGGGGGRLRGGRAPRGAGPGGASRPW